MVYLLKHNSEKSKHRNETTCSYRRDNNMCLCTVYIFPNCLQFKRSTRIYCYVYYYSFYCTVLSCLNNGKAKLISFIVMLVCNIYIYIYTSPINSVFRNISCPGVNFLRLERIWGNANLLNVCVVLPSTNVARWCIHLELTLGQLKALCCHMTILLGEQKW